MSTTLRKGIGVALFLFASTGFAQEEESDKIAPLKSQLLKPSDARVLKATAREDREYIDGELVVGVQKIVVNVKLEYGNPCRRKNAGDTIFTTIEDVKKKRDIVRFWRESAKTVS